MKRYLISLGLFLLAFNLAAQNKNYFRIEKNTGKYFKGAATGTRRLALNTDLVDLGFNGVANIGVQYVTMKHLGFEFVYGRSVNQNTQTNIPLPYFYFGEYQSRVLYSMQQTVIGYLGQMGLSTNMYIGLNFWQIHLENKFLSNNIPDTRLRKASVNFIIGSQRPLLGPIQIGWEAGIGNYKVKGPDLSKYDVSFDKQNILSLTAKVKLGYMIW